MSDNYDPTLDPQHDSSVPDLDGFEDEFNDADVRERDFEPVPDGRYQVIVDQVELKRARSSGNPMLAWTLRILAPTHRGRLLWRNNMIASKENLSWLKTDLHTCGLELAKLADLQHRLGELVGVKLEITKRRRGDNDNVYLNRRIFTDAEDDASGYDAVSAESRMPF